MRVHVQVLDTYAGPDLSRPISVQYEDDAGYDLYAANDAVLYPGERIAMGTGLAFALPAPEIQSYESYGTGLGKPRTAVQQRSALMRLVPRSGLAVKQGLSLVNTPATIDAGYRGEVMALLLNTNSPIDRLALGAMVINKEDSLPEALDIIYDGLESKAIIIRRGDRICQAIFEWVVQPQFEVVAELAPTSRGARGLGSSGTG